MRKRFNKHCRNIGAVSGGRRDFRIKLCLEYAHAEVRHKNPLRVSKPQFLRKTF